MNTIPRTPAYDEGRDAALAGQTDADNPHAIGTDEAMDWEDGRLSMVEEMEGGE